MGSSKNSDCSETLVVCTVRLFMVASAYLLLFITCYKTNESNKIIQYLYKDFNENGLRWKTQTSQIQTTFQEMKSDLNSQGKKIEDVHTSLLNEVGVVEQRLVEKVKSVSQVMIDLLNDWDEKGSRHKLNEKLEQVHTSLHQTVKDNNNKEDIAELLEKVTLISEKFSVLVPSEMAHYEYQSELCPTFLHNNQQIPCWLLGSEKRCYCFSLFMTNWKDARERCGPERIGKLKSNLVSFETREEFDMVQEHVSQIPELSVAVSASGYSYWTSGRYNESNKITKRWEWSKTSIHGEPSSSEKYTPIINQDQNGRLFFRNHITEGKNALGECLIFFHNRDSIYNMDTFIISPNFCSNPYRFICEREFLN